MVPLRFVSETMGLKVDWNDAAQTVILSTPGYKAVAVASTGTTGSGFTTVVSAAPVVMPGISNEYRELNRIFGTNIVLINSSQLYYYENGIKQEGYDPGLFSIFEAEYGLTLRINLERFDEKNAGIYKSMLKVYFPASYEAVYGEILQSIKTGSTVDRKTYDNRDFSCIRNKYEVTVNIGK